MSATRNPNYDDRKYLGLLLLAGGVVAAFAAAAVAWPGLRHILSHFFG